MQSNHQWAQTSNLYFSTGCTSGWKCFLELTRFFFVHNISCDIFWTNKAAILRLESVVFHCMYHSLTKKGPIGTHCAHTRGWADICNIAAFYHKKATMFTLSQPTTGYCTPTNPPSTSLNQFSVWACVVSHKWTSSSVLTFQEKDSKFHAISFTGKPSHIERLNQNFSETVRVTFRYCVSTYITFLCNYRLTLHHVDFPHEVTDWVGALWSKL